MKITVIHHSADFDGIFCREIARKFLPDAELIGWDFGDDPLKIPAEGQIYILDLPVDRPFGEEFSGRQHTKFFMTPEVLKRVIWIDHHKSSIDSHPSDIAGYRIDGVAACRLAWQWFSLSESGRDEFLGNQSKSDFIDRKVSEPYAVQLAGEYDVWDKRNPEAEIWQFALRSEELKPNGWDELLALDLPAVPGLACHLMQSGAMLQRYQQKNDAYVCNAFSYLLEFEGLKFLALNTTARNSLAFAAKDVPETGHDALLKFNWNGRQWSVSMYHAAHRTDIDLSKIAVKYGGGGHRGACGFSANELPFVI